MNHQNRESSYPEAVYLAASSQIVRDTPHSTLEPTWHAHPDKTPGQEHRGLMGDGRHSSRAFTISCQRSTVCWLIALLLIAIIATVGGAVGGTRAVAQARRECIANAHTATSPQSTTNTASITSTPTPQASTPSSSSSTLSIPSATAPGGTDFTSLPIPQEADFKYTSPLNNGTDFDVAYNKDIYLVNDPREAGFALAETLELCILACVNARTLQLAGFGSGCMAATWRPQLTNGWSRGGALILSNCFLKVDVAGIEFQSGPERDGNGPAWFAIAQERNNS